MKKTPQPRLIQSVDRALNILEVLADRDESVKLTELARMMGLDSSTVYRLLSTLRVHGYAEQDHRDRKYHLGPKAIELGQKALQKFTLRSKGAPFVRELAAKTGEAAHLVSLVGGQAIYVDNRAGAGLLTVSAQIGGVALPYCTATGKAVAANLSETELERLLASTELRELTENTITDLGVLRSHFQEVRDQGYAVDDEEYHLGIRCLAAPVFDHSGAVVGSIGISASISSLTPDKVEQYKSIVMGAARELSRSMGCVQGAE